MKYILEFLHQYGISILHSVTAVIISYVSLEIKHLYKVHSTDRIKKEVTISVCQAIHKLYPTLSFDEKLNKALFNIEQILKEKGIIINDLELKMYILSNLYYEKELLGGGS